MVDLAFHHGASHALCCSKLVVLQKNTTKASAAAASPSALRAEKGDMHDAGEIAMAFELVPGSRVGEFDLTSIFMPPFYTWAYSCFSYRFPFVSLTPCYPL